jgi:sterol desaturase/sphingolipid hydroxylase (fatty acid hydroxylase superfamily)
MADMAMLAALAFLVLFLVLDAWKPARRYAEVRRWRLKGLGFLVLALALNTTVPALLAGLIGERSLLPGSRLGTAGGFVVGLLALELVVYWVHRASHRVDFLWRWFHQMHHSAERFDTYGAFLFHPFDMLLNILLSVAVPGAILGLGAEATGLVGAVSFFLAFFQHANIRTPRALGWLVQRPESHGVHHQRGVHAMNFGNLSLWDMAFGTFANPAAAPALAGFYEGGTRRMKEMLLGRDVSGGNRGQSPEATSPLALGAVR